MWDDVLAFVGDRLRDHDGSHDVQHALGGAQRRPDLLGRQRAASGARCAFHDARDRGHVDDPMCAPPSTGFCKRTWSTEARVVCSAIR